MKVFVIHRFKDRTEIKEELKSFKKGLKFKVKWLFLNSCSDSTWKRKALKTIKDSDCILVINKISCYESENATWEIDTAKELNKYTFEHDLIDFRNDQNAILGNLKTAYGYEDEFNSSFTDESENKFELYKIMVESSERLIDRRQKTNAFFITIIGSLLAVGGLLHKVDVLNKDSFGIVSLFCITALLLCNSWRNLLDNFGKLNTGKFKVIGKLEQQLGDQIFNAEWIALGKGNRKEKYRSFTETEKNVPLFIACLFFILSITTSIIKIIC